MFSVRDFIRTYFHICFPVMPSTQAPNVSANVSTNDPAYSPITLSAYWSRAGRLLFVFIFSVFGSIMNIFFISTLCLNETVKKIGNIFLACAGISDLFITAAVMPIIAVVLLSGEWETLHVCKFLQFVTQTSTYAFSLNFAFVGAENYFRISRNHQEYNRCVIVSIEIMAFTLFFLSIVTAGAGVYMELDYDYCKREHEGNYHFKLITSIFFTIVPCFMVYGFLIITIFMIRKKVRIEPRYRRSHTYGQDCTMIASNIIAYTMYILAWIPYFLIVNKYSNSSNPSYYNSAWAGAIRSIVLGLMYGIMDRNYRYTYGNLFYYLFCKVHLASPTPRRRRRPRTVVCTQPLREVRVHILHRALCTTTPQRSNSGIRETQNL